MDNSYVILAVILIAVVAVIGNVISSGSEKRKVFKNNKYAYFAKDLIMSRTEADFFMKLNSVVGERYFVFPQVHLSALLNHRVKGQDWKIAFRHINGKSVDYVLCDKLTLQPVYALELDDYTHDRRDRAERDVEVERIFKQAQLPLVRFKSANVSSAEIIQALTDARSLANVR